MRRHQWPAEGLNKGPWSPEEDEILSKYIKLYGIGKWTSVSRRAGLKRCGKSCRLRWLNYLRPNIKRGNISEDEEDLIIRVHKLLGNRSSLIAGRLPGRTDNEIKNYWNSNLKKKFEQKKGTTLHSSKQLHNPPVEELRATETTLLNQQVKLRNTSTMNEDQNPITTTTVDNGDDHIITEMLKKESEHDHKIPFSNSSAQQNDYSLDLQMDFDLNDLLAMDGHSINVEAAAAAEAGNLIISVPNDTTVSSGQLDVLIDTTIRLENPTPSEPNFQTSNAFVSSGQLDVLIDTTIRLENPTPSEPNFQTCNAFDLKNFPPFLSLEDEWIM